MERSLTMQNLPELSDDVIVDEELEGERLRLGLMEVVDDGDDIESDLAPKQKVTWISLLEREYAVEDRIKICREYARWLQASLKFESPKRRKTSSDGGE